MLSEKQALKKKEMISKQARLLPTVDAVVEFCSENFILGPMSKTNAEFLCQQND